MKKRKLTVIINWLMLISLLTVFVSGILVKMMPGMWMGIVHSVSGLLLVVCAVIHMLQHNMLKMNK